jgi:hypothetical protein
MSEEIRVSELVIIATGAWPPEELLTEDIPPELGCPRYMAICGISKRLR